MIRYLPLELSVTEDGIMTETGLTINKFTVDLAHLHPTAPVVGSLVSQTSYVYLPKNGFFSSRLPFSQFIYLDFSGPNIILFVNDLLM